MATTTPSAELRRFCLALEEYRRTPEGRVRTSEEFLATFFPHEGDIVADQVFRYISRETRAKIISGWKIRGEKMALRDDDAKVEAVVHDALLSGDLDHAIFESGIPANVLINSVPLTDWWNFWRGGKLSVPILGHAFNLAHEQKLFDANWFLATATTEGNAHGIDVFAPKLSKEELSAWVRAIATSGDASPDGIIGALGWEKVLGNMPLNALSMLIDALIQRIGLALEVPLDLALETDVETTFVG